MEPSEPMLMVPLYYILTILLGVSFASRLDNGSTHKSSSSLSNAPSSLRVVAKLALLQPRSRNKCAHSCTRSRAMLLCIIETRSQTVIREEGKEFVKACRPAGDFVRLWSCCIELSFFTYLHIQFLKYGFSLDFGKNFFDYYMSF